MTKRKPGRPPALPVESPHWIAYSAALQEAMMRFGSERLAIAKLDAALASDTIRCKIERVGKAPELVKRSDQVAAVFLPFELRNDPAEESPTIFVNSKPREGWLFLWNYDLIKFFNVSDDGVEAPAVKVQKIPAAGGRPVVHDWIKITLIAVQLRRNFPAIKPTPLISKLQERLEEEGIKAPVLSELQKLTDQLFSFDRKPD